MPWGGILVSGSWSSCNCAALVLGCVWGWGWGLLHPLYPPLFAHDQFPNWVQAGAPEAPSPSTGAGGIPACLNPLQVSRPLLGHPLARDGCLDVHGLAPPRCLTIFLAPAGIFLEMRQRAGRQEPRHGREGRQPGEAGCGEAEFLVPGAGSDMLLAAARATRGGRPTLWGCSRPPLGQLITSCPLPLGQGERRPLLVVGGGASGRCRLEARLGPMALPCKFLGQAFKTGDHVC